MHKLLALWLAFLAIGIGWDMGNALSRMVRSRVRLLMRRLRRTP
jgi:hypothetical protein